MCPTLKPKNGIRVSVNSLITFKAPQHYILGAAFWYISMCAQLRKSGKKLRTRTMISLFKVMNVRRLLNNRPCN